jgi:hypothetical protein
MGVGEAAGAGVPLPAAAELPGPSDLVDNPRMIACHEFRNNVTLKVQDGKRVS